MPLIAGNNKQIRKNILEDSIPTPNVFPKANPRSFAGIKYEMAPKNLPTYANVFPKTHPMRANDDP
jgi:hypothetical protein